MQGKAVWGQARMDGHPHKVREEHVTQESQTGGTLAGTGYLVP